jgi:hypothetical protein
VPHGNLSPPPRRHFYNIESERLENNYIEILLATQIMKQIMQISCKSPDMTHYDMIDVATFSRTDMCQLHRIFKTNSNYTTQILTHFPLQSVV